MAPPALRAARRRRRSLNSQARQATGGVGYTAGTYDTHRQRGWTSRLECRGEGAVAGSIALSDPPHEAQTHLTPPPTGSRRKSRWMEGKETRSPPETSTHELRVVPYVGSTPPAPPPPPGGLHPPSHPSVGSWQVGLRVCILGRDGWGGCKRLVFGSPPRSLHRCSPFNFPLHPHAHQLS
jgi:hypothetical protein